MFCCIFLVTRKILNQTVNSFHDKELEKKAIKTQGGIQIFLNLQSRNVNELDISLVCLFNGISTFVGCLMPKPFF